MKIFFIAFFIEAIFSLIMKENLSLAQNDILIHLYMLINFIIITLIMYKKSKNKKMFMILFIGFSLRFIMLFFDSYIMRLPFNDVDANAFHRCAVKTANALPRELLEFYNGFYTKVLGVIYYIFGPFRIWGQFINIIFYMMTGLKLLEIFNLLKIKEKNTNIGLIIFLYAPIPLLMGQALLRESTIYYFLTLSVYYFLKSFNGNKFINIFLAIICTYIAGLYHSGVLICILIYIYYLIFYNQKTKKIKYGVFHNIVLVIVILLFIGYISSNSNDLFNKVNMDTGGGSSYLVGIEINSAKEFILFAPIKAFFLLFSPMIWMFRGSLDIFTFLFDSLMFIWSIIFLIKERKFIKEVEKSLILCLILGALIFGMGTLNSGTAIRHRNKFLIFLLIPFIKILDKKYRRR